LIFSLHLAWSLKLGSESNNGLLEMSAHLALHFPPAMPGRSGRKYPDGHNEGCSPPVPLEDYVSFEIGSLKPTYETTTTSTIILTTPTKDRPRPKKKAKKVPGPSRYDLLKRDA
jgi:hypothetical protein